MDDVTVIVLKSDLDLLIKNVVELSNALTMANVSLENMNKNSTQWVLKYHEQKSKVSELEHRVKELENGDRA